VPPPPVPLVLQVRFVALRASPNPIWACAGTDINKKATETWKQTEKHFTAFFTVSAVNVME
jgi:hypothetical protein